MTVHEFDESQLTKHLIEALQSWPLYRRLEYKGADEIIAVPTVIRLHCLSCKLFSHWQTNIIAQRIGNTAVSEKHKTGFSQKTYRCKNCGVGTVTYYFFWGNEREVSVFFKVGQYPELEERVSEALANALGADDLKAYKNALRLRNFNLGIAAVAYLRRVVENRLTAC
jgi:hypothetical protein